MTTHLPGHSCHSLICTYHWAYTKHSQILLFASLQELESLVWLRYLWRDARLTWDPSEYGGVTAVRVPGYKLWRPDITLFNNMEKPQGCTRFVFSCHENTGMCLPYEAPLQICLEDSGRKINQAVCKILNVNLLCPDFQYAFGDYLHSDGDQNVMFNCTSDCRHFTRHCCYCIQQRRCALDTRTESEDQM